MTILLEDNLSWRDVAAVAEGANLALSAGAWDRIDRASAIVTAIVEQGVRAYGVNTGVGALSDTVVNRDSQGRLSRKIVLSHACGVGPWLGRAEVRAIMTAQIANFAHGYSGVRDVIVKNLLALLSKDCIPCVPLQGSAGYLTHNAHVSLVLIGEGRAHLGDAELSGRDALSRIGLSPLVLQAKEGLSLVNGTACSTGLTSLALARADRMFDWADAIAALTMEAAGCQSDAFSEAVLALRKSERLETAGASLRGRMAGSGLIAKARGRRTQDALSLRAVPHVHGAARDMFDFVAATVDDELASVTDNPAVGGTPDAPRVWSEAHAVTPALGQALDALAIALAQIGMMSERRIDRLVNPLVSGLPAFLASDAGENSGFMIAQYTATALCSENRRLAAPASTDGGVTSALQEDFLAHPTAAANKLNAIIANLEYILAIELMAAAQAHDIVAPQAPRAAGTQAVYQSVRTCVGPYFDDRPLGNDIEALRTLIRKSDPPVA
ncbi:histidine ammonia-lyase [Jiella sp. MQZ9-1]|uniref:Histidine ammonia-lyase n=1 Tax=Jiella flava TaxID=2816857 RepID=A0A939FVI5_9HYPH|nr:histidine ammonia-lyase [Jiella flava]MCD2470892.1 histidine ammonia-lyase [Jiella flava]